MHLKEKEVVGDRWRLEMVYVSAYTFMSVRVQQQSITGSRIAAKLTFLFLF